MKCSFAALLLLVAAALQDAADDAWSETSVRSVVESGSVHRTPKTHKQIPLAPTGSAGVEQTKHMSTEIERPEQRLRDRSDTKATSTVLAEVSAGGGSSTEAFIVFKLPESGDFKCWLFGVICFGIIVFTLLFETWHHWMHHYLEHKRGWRQIFEKVQDELMLLGLISFVFFFVTQSLTNTDEITIEHFELGHYLLFAIGVSYSLHNIVIYNSMTPHFHRWLQNEVAVRHPTAQYAALEVDGGRHNQKLLKIAEWTCIRSAYIDKFKLPARFDYGEYLHLVSIDYLLEIAEADWVAWSIVFLVSALLVGAVSAFAHLNDLDSGDPHAMCRAATYTAISFGWLLCLGYYLCGYHLAKAKRFALETIGCGDTHKLLTQLTMVLNDDGTKTQRDDGAEVSKVWPKGWTETQGHANDTGDKPLLAEGLNMSYETFFTQNVLRILTGFMLCSNIYFALMICIFVRAVYSSFDSSVVVLVYAALATPYFLIIFYLSPHTVAKYVLLSAFKEKSEDVALEIQEDLEYAERMAEKVRKGVDVSGKPYEAIEDIFDALDYNKDGSVDHREFALFMQQLDVEISKKQLSKLISIVDPRSHGKVSKTSLMYWLFPEEQLKISMSIGEKIGLSLARDSGQPV